MSGQYEQSYTRRRILAATVASAGAAALGFGANRGLKALFPDDRIVGENRQSTAERALVSVSAASTQLMELRGAGSRLQRAPSTLEGESNVAKRLKDDEVIAAFSPLIYIGQDGKTWYGFHKPVTNGPRVPQGEIDEDRLVWVGEDDEEATIVFHTLSSNGNDAPLELPIAIKGDHIVSTDPDRATNTLPQIARADMFDPAAATAFFEMYTTPNPENSPPGDI